MNWLKANRVAVQQPVYNNKKIKRNSSLELRHPNSPLELTAKMRSNPSFKKAQNLTMQAQSSLPKLDKLPYLVKLPEIARKYRQQQMTKVSQIPKQIYYQTQIYRAMKNLQNNYMANLARTHFTQTTEILRMTKNLKISKPKQQLNLEKTTKHTKTIYLDLDETLIHTDEACQNYSVKLKFPIQSGDCIEAGVNIRPYCYQFLEELSQIAELIIFTASSPSYADVILDYLDPENRYFSHRLYRQHCTLEKGFYIKDLRTINRNIEDVVIVDNSAFSYLIQKQNGVPILPFYHFQQDRELESLLKFLKQIVEMKDCRKLVRETFMWSEYLKQKVIPKQYLMKNYKKLCS